MSIQSKPDYKIFASDAKSGEVETFPDILRGWGVTIDRTGEIPPMEWFNAIGKRADEWLLYITQRGIPEWDTSIDYPKSSMVMFGDNFYVSKKETKGESPGVSSAAWSRLSDFIGVPQIVQSTGTSTTQVMSQDAVTKLANEKQPAGKYADANYFAQVGTYSMMESPNHKRRLVISDDGSVSAHDDDIGSAATFIFSPSGEMTLGSVPANLVTGLFSQYRNVTSERVLGTEYKNASNKPKFVIISHSNYDGSLTIDVNGEQIYSSENTSNGETRMSSYFIVPPNGTYKVDRMQFFLWAECE